MGNLLKISFILLFLCSCSPKYEISSHVQVNDVENYSEELYLDNINFKIDNENIIYIDNENWNIIKTNLIKIHYHILKLKNLNNIQKK